MLLGFDIGNTHIVPIFYNNSGEIMASFRIPTDLKFTEDTLFIMLKNLAETKKINIFENYVIASLYNSTKTKNYEFNYNRLED